MHRRKLKKKSKYNKNNPLNKQRLILFLLFIFICKFINSKKAIDEAINKTPIKKLLSINMQNNIKNKKIEVVILFLISNVIKYYQSFF